MKRNSQVLTVAQMRAAEQALIDCGETVSSLMERAGKGAADWVWRVAAGRPVTVLCGPGNNGGDGYVIARDLARRGARVTVVAPLEPTTDAAIAARKSWAGPIEAHGRGGVLVDCLFGSGLSRALTAELQARLAAEAGRHAIRLAVDLPSGIEADTGRPLNDNLPAYEMTLALGAFKPAHALMPALALLGETRLVSIGVGEVPGAPRMMMQQPELSAPARDAHKYSRGLVMVVEGPITGAALLACLGAMHSGAGAVRLWTQRLHPAMPPDVVLGSKPLEEMLADKRLGAVIAGPGLGLDGPARKCLAEVLAAGVPCVIDADALRLIDREALEGFSAPLVLTPHQGEMDKLKETFDLRGNGKVQLTIELAVATGAVVAFKGPDTVIAAADGQVFFAPSSTSWLSVGGSGDVLAGIVGARLAATGEPLRAAREAVWLHSEAGRLAGPAFLASDLASALPAAISTCLPR